MGDFRFINSGENNYFEFIGQTIDVSANSASLSLLTEISTVLEKISVSTFEGLGNFEDYKVLFELANTVENLKLDLNIGSLESVSECCQAISDKIQTVSARLSYIVDEHNLFRVQDLIKIRNSFAVILNLLDSIEHFIKTVEYNYPIYLEIQRRNQIYLDSISHCIDNTYCHLDRVFSHDNTHHSIPSYLLIPPPIQCQVNRFCDYNRELTEFSESLGCCKNKDDSSSCD
jgi:hypothetical protein